MKQLWLFAGLAATVCGIVLIGTPVASGANYNCTGVVAGGTINGNVNAGPGCDLEGVHVTGNVSVNGNGSLTTNNGTTIDGNVEIQNDTGANSICDTTIGGNLLVHNNSGSTIIGCATGPTTVGGKVDIHNNSGPVTISSTDVGGNLDCHNDKPAASAGATGTNTVGGKSSGECTTSTTVPCPSTGCTVTVSDGNTDVTVDVPGGGNNGNLTVTLSAPPADDGCGPYDPETGAPPHPAGDIVTVDPPSGYTGSNPITADVTYHFSNGLIEECKSNNDRPPYTALPECDFGESDTPTNVPCWSPIGEEFITQALVYMTSKDPSLGGHY